MTCLHTQARPYARAAFEVAKSEQAIESWLMMLQTLAFIVVNKNVTTFIKNPTISTQQQAALLLDFMEKPLTTSQQNFVQLLAQKRKLYLLPAINARVQVIQAQDLQTDNVVVISAIELTTEQKTALSQALAQRFNKNISLNAQVDHSLIGGVIIRTPHWVIDNSVKSKLQQLKIQVVG